eukprot:TRINITY_DN2277_c0_g1_i1.p1 TRINITY_DN2277_c0_g1~~TRINITY_DN2277_c0_g1_i1.p1  ORF type:complete len:351 (-),score=81.08 TRINITY_DN2277_c0_g1_i1:271-1323(-)
MNPNLLKWIVGVSACLLFFIVILQSTRRSSSFAYSASIQYPNSASSLVPSSPSSSSSSSSAIDFSPVFSSCTCVSLTCPIFPESLDKFPASPSYLVPKDVRFRYLDEFQAIGGWLAVENILLVHYLSIIQHQLGITGSIGEIGIHHGKFFIGIAHTAWQGETIFALDIFDKQNLNIDHSGEGDYAIFESNARRYGIDLSHVHVVAASSDSITPAYFPAHSIPRFRMFSVDGGHTASITLNDLSLIGCVLKDGGVIVLDDFTNLQWLGVQEGAYEYMLRQSRVVPFALGSNKLLFTTISHQQLYFEALCGKGIEGCAHGPSQIMHGYKICDCQEKPTAITASLKAILKDSN